jgi:hypothetical protein
VDTTCLLGNGVSLAYNADLGVAQLTTDLLDKFKQLGVTEPERALAAYATNLSAIPGEHFEALLGPLESTSRALTHMPGFAGLVESARADVVSAIRTTSDFLAGIHRIGTAVTLGHIALRTIGGDYWDGAWPVAEALIALGTAKTLTVGTLNYDGLLHSGLMEAGLDAWGQTAFPIADLADGRMTSARKIEVVAGRAITGHPLRRFADLPSDRAILLQLHGSLGWLRHEDEPDQLYKFKLPDLRDIAYWNERQADRTPWQPVVVLTDRKDTAIEGWPFSLAYSSFYSRLLAADRWLVVGYGLGDAPINALFSSVVRERRRMGYPGTPPTLIVGYGEPVNSLRDRAVERLGLEQRAVTANVDGVPDVFKSDDWDAWANLEPHEIAG